MEEITNLSYNAINKYFNTLKLLGYKSYNEVYKLIALIGIEEMFDMFEFITEEDLKEIITAVNCLSGTTCMIDFLSYNSNDSIIHKSKLNYLFRISEYDNLRTGNNNFRIII